MGMSASQVNLLALTSRKFDNERQTLKLSHDKTALSRDMQKVSADYQKALKSTVLKWTNNSGATYMDLSYDNLMKPSVLNQNSPYLLTDMHGKVVIDENYVKYAEMLDAAGGNWEGSTRAKILAGLTGISETKIADAEAANQNLNEINIKVADLEAQTARALDKATTKLNFKDLLEKMGDVSNVHWEKDKGDYKNGVLWDYEWGEKNGSAHWRLDPDKQTSKNLLKNVVEEIKNNIKNYLTEEDFAKFEKACDETLDVYNRKFDAGFAQDIYTTDMISSEKGNAYCVDVRIFAHTLVNAYEDANGTTGTSDHSGNLYYCGVDRESDSYKAYMDKKAEYDAALAEQKEINAQNNTILTADEEKQIAFYDGLFSAIAEKGWTFNNKVTNTDYLNQMLQNNLYTLTTVNREEVLDENSEEYYFKNSYTTNIASNFTNVVCVKDSDAASEALVEYEHKKSIISAKESRIDLRMTDLQTELSAINQMLQGIEQVKNDNIERTFGTFA